MKAKARLVLHPKVAKQINWLTRNYDKEIGAVGIGEMKQVDGYPSVYVEELFFPKQEVTSSTVSISAVGMVGLKKEMGDKMNRMMFYWHRHPSGSAGCSGTDEEDTFASFMNDKANRRYFAFLQTATSGTGMVHEARIDIRDPIRVTIENPNIDLVVEKTQEEKEIQEYLLKQIEDKVTEKTYPVTTTNAYSWGTNNYTPKNTSLLPPVKDSNEDAIAKLFDMDTPKVELYFDGQGQGVCYVMADDDLAIIIDYELGDSIVGTVKSYDTYEIVGNKGWYSYKLIPNKNKYNALKTEMKRIYKTYTNKLKEDALSKGDESLDAQSIGSPDYFKIDDNPELVDEVTNNLYMIGYFDEVADKGTYIITQFVDYENLEILGDVHMFNDDRNMLFKGQKLVFLVEQIVADLLHSNKKTKSVIEIKPDKTNNKTGGKKNETKPKQTK